MMKVFSIISKKPSKGEELEIVFEPDFELPTIH
jgi:hypothetical protein